MAERLGSVRLGDAEVIAIVISRCKDELEGVIGPTTLHMMDAGSPWGRALLKATRDVKLARADCQSGDSSGGPSEDS